MQHLLLAAAETIAGMEIVCPVETVLRLRRMTTDELGRRLVVLHQTGTTETRKTIAYLLAGLQLNAPGTADPYHALARLLGRWGGLRSRRDPRGGTTGTWFRFCLPLLLHGELTALVGPGDLAMVPFCRSSKRLGSRSPATCQ